MGEFIPRSQIIPLLLHRDAFDFLPSFPIFPSQCFAHSIPHAPLPGTLLHCEDFNCLNFKHGRSLFISLCSLPSFWRANNNLSRSFSSLGKHCEVWPDDNVTSPGQGPVNHAGRRTICRSLLAASRRQGLTLNLPAFFMVLVHFHVNCSLNSAHNVKPNTCDSFLCSSVSSQTLLRCQNLTGQNIFRLKGAK